MSDMRIGDAEREEAVRRLGEHYEAGRLSADEHSERVEAALRATTQNELGAVFSDLPFEQPRAEAPRQSRPVGPPFGKIPVPLLVALGVIALLASVGCVVGGGHPPVFLVAAIVAGMVVYRKRRMA